MRRTAWMAGVGGAALAATTALAGPAAAAPAHHRPQHHGSAVFVQTDNPNGNAIVAYDRSSDGTLREAGTYRTGGLGGVLTESSPDHLSSGHSLVYDGAHHLLYAVNAGSDTLTVFAVHGDRLARRQVVSSGGSFPVSVAVQGDLVYVLNSRDGGSLQGYLALGGFLLRIPTWHRDLGLDPNISEGSAPGQVSFTPDGSKLIVTTESAGDSIDVFAVHGLLGPSAKPVVHDAQGRRPFAFSFDSGGHLVVAESLATAAATFTVNLDGTLTLVDRKSTGQAGTCWITISGVNVYASNAHSAAVTGFRDDGSGKLTAISTTATDTVPADGAASSDGHNLYIQTDANGIVDEFRINPGGSLASIGSVTVPNAVGGQGIAIT